MFSSCFCIGEPKIRSAEGVEVPIKSTTAATFEQRQTSDSALETGVEVFEAHIDAARFFVQDTATIVEKSAEDKMSGKSLYAVSHYITCRENSLLPPYSSSPCLSPISSDARLSARRGAASALTLRCCPADRHGDATIGASRQHSSVASPSSGTPKRALRLSCAKRQRASCRRTYPLTSRNWSLAASCCLLMQTYQVILCARRLLVSGTRREVAHQSVTRHTRHRLATLLCCALLKSDYLKAIVTGFTIGSLYTTV